VLNGRGSARQAIYVSLGKSRQNHVGRGKARAAAGASPLGALRGSPTPLARKLVELALSLAEGLRQGPSVDKSVLSHSRTEGVGHEEKVAPLPLIEDNRL
jgi:hypothetical protein